MAVIGLQYDKILLERKEPLSGKVSVNNNTKLTKVEKTEVRGRDAMKFSFVFKVSYLKHLDGDKTEEVASITFDGFANVVASAEIIKEEAERWKKENKVSNELMDGVLNQILERCNIASLMIAREASLPSPVSFPRVKTK